MQTTNVYDLKVETFNKAVGERKPHVFLYVEKLAHIIPLEEIRGDRGYLQISSYVYPIESVEIIYVAFPFTSKKDDIAKLESYK